MTEVAPVSWILGILGDGNHKDHVATGALRDGVRRCKIQRRAGGAVASRDPERSGIGHTKKIDRLAVLRQHYLVGADHYGFARVHATHNDGCESIIVAGVWRGIEFK